VLAGIHHCEGGIVCWKTSKKDWGTVASMTPWRWVVGADYVLKFVVDVPEMNCILLAILGPCYEILE
jgi:hypothetical protein